MKAQIRRWSNEENKNYFVTVDLAKNNNSQGPGDRINVYLDGILLCSGADVEDALKAAENIVRTRKITND